MLQRLPPQKLGFKSSKDDDGRTISASESAKREIESGTHKLETLLNAAIDKNFDLFELYTMQNILTIKSADRPFMRLAHYEGIEPLATGEPVTALRRKLQASQKLHLALEAERAKNDALLAKLRGVLGDGPLGFLRDRGTLEQGGSERPIATTAEFTLSQLQSLRDLSASLRGVLPDLAGSETQEEEGKSWRRERAEYIERSSRKYLERTGGLEFGAHGEVRDGEWQGGGPSLSKSEVEGLEKAVTMVAGTQQGDAMDES